jgi:GWxTD domain-containing protein
MQRISLLLLFLFVFTVINVEAQRGVTYESLAFRADQPNIYTDFILLPGSEKEAKLSVIFRMDYDYLPFQRIQPGSTIEAAGAEFYSQVTMNLEVFPGRASTGRSAQSIEGYARGTWADTARATTFEETRSRLHHLQGVITTDIDMGEYNYMLQLLRGERTGDQTSNRRNVKVPEFSEGEYGSLILLKEFENNGDRANATLLNYSRNIIYGQGYSLLALLPDNHIDKALSINIYRHVQGTDSTYSSDPIFKREISRFDRFKASGTEVQKSGDDISIELIKDDNGLNYAFISVPNESFPNSRFRIVLKADGVEKPLASMDVVSRWFDMPVALLNLDIAISKLRFITDERTVRDMSRGSATEKERRFREFWAERDPTPDTEFNELMAEYYRRIDFAFKNFTSPEVRGFDSDQGKTYIRLGPPSNIRRLFPTNGPTREIWEYPNQTIIFEARSGFGDYRIVSQ